MFSRYCIVEYFMCGHIDQWDWGGWTGLVHTGPAGATEGTEPRQLHHLLLYPGMSSCIIKLNFILFSTYSHEYSSWLLLYIHEYACFSRLHWIILFYFSVIKAKKIVHNIPYYWMHKRPTEILCKPTYENDSFYTLRRNFWSMVDKHSQLNKM